MGKMIKVLTHMDENVVLKLILFYNRNINCACIQWLLFQEFFVCPSLRGQKRALSPSMRIKFLLPAIPGLLPGLFLTLGYLGIQNIPFGLR